MKNVIRHDGRTGGVRVYPSEKAREQAAGSFFKGGWFNHFIYFKDVAGEFALEYGHAAWLAPGQSYVNR